MKKKKIFKGVLALGIAGLGYAVYLKEYAPRNYTTEAESVAFEKRYRNVAGISAALAALGSSGLIISS